MQEMTEIDEATVKSFENGYNGLEIYLKKSKYIAGDNITIADFSVLATVTSMKVNTYTYPTNFYWVLWEVEFCRGLNICLCFRYLCL